MNETEYQLMCGDMLAASASGPKEKAWKEIMHYYWQYLEDGECVIYEVTRRICSVPQEGEDGHKG